MVAKKPGKEEKKDVLVVGQDDLCVSLWWDIKVAQVVFGPKFSFRARNLTNELVRYSNFVQDMLSALHLIMIDKLSLSFVT